MLRFRQMKSLQKFASMHGSIYNHFNQERHLVDRQTYKLRRSAALAEWQNLMACAVRARGGLGQRRAVHIRLTAPLLLLRQANPLKAVRIK